MIAASIVCLLLLGSLVSAIPPDFQGETVGEYAPISSEPGIRTRRWIGGGGFGPGFYGGPRFGRPWGYGGGYGFRPWGGFRGGYGGFGRGYGWGK